MPNPLRDVPQQAVDLVKSFEGIPDGDPSTVNLDAYLCPADVWTIGWGHAIVDEGAQLKGAAAKARARNLFPGGITFEQAEVLLRGDLLPRSAKVSSLIKVPVDDGQFGALIALLFNIGAANLGASTLLRKLNAGDLAGAAEQFLAWNKARVGGVLQELAGLTRRRRAEAAMFRGEDWRAASAATRSRAALGVLPVPEMPQAEAAALAAAKRPARKGAAGKKVAKKAAQKKAVTTKRAPAKRPAPAAKRTPAKPAAAPRARPARKATRPKKG